MEQTRTRMMKRSHLITGLSAPVFLLLITCLSFGPVIGELGYYWDDWAKILVPRLWGLADYFQYYAEDRPLSSLTHILFTPILGTTPLPWHVFTLLLRWLSAWGMLWALNGLWPRNQRENLLAALLFVIYPVFVSQPAAVTFHQQWLQYALFFLSLGAMIYAYRQRTAGNRRAFHSLTALSLLALIAQISVTEYFIPLELVRPLVLWMLLAGEHPNPRSRVRPVLQAWWIYLIPAAAYSIYRLFFVQLPGADPYAPKTLYELSANPLPALKQAVLVAFVDLYHILVDVWGDLLKLKFTQVPPFTLASYGAAALAGLASAAALIFLPLSSSEAKDTGSQQPETMAMRKDDWPRDAFLLGLAAVLLGPVPAWITGRQVVFDFHSDRYAMAAMFGAALLLAALICWLAQGRVQRAVMASVLVSFAVILHLRVANDYRWIWIDQQRTFWELSWRAPGLKAPTALFYEFEPFPNQGLFSTSAALNLMYPQEAAWQSAGSPTIPDSRDRLAFWVYALHPRWNQAPDDLEIGLSTTFRSLHFEGQTPDTLLLYNDPQFANCLWVLSERDNDHPYLSERMRGFLPISNLERILPQALEQGYPPASILGREPPHNTWCYYFETADLARQQQDWAQIAGLYDAALAGGFHTGASASNSPYEWLPFVEGLARAGRVEDASALTLQAYERDPNYQPMLCSLWSSLTAEAPAELACGEGTK